MGRDEAKEELTRRLRQARLVTVAGPGGAGKTRLALEVAAELDEAGQRVVFVELARLSAPDSVLPTLATALGVGADPTKALFEAVVARLGDGKLVLVLDNCEQVRAGSAALAQALLGACRGLRILATSRERLGVAGEVVWRLPPLSLPKPGTVSLPQAFVESEAVQLFCERAAALQRGFLPSADNVEAIVEICRRLDGNPLAIELAAARVVARTPAEIAEHLDERFEALGGGASTAPPRHQTLRATLEWSCQLLSMPERALLRRLSVFSGSFGLPGAEAVCGGGDVEPRQVLGLLTRLVDKSLVVSDTSGRAARFCLLETVRAYAAEQLEEMGNTAVLAERHAAWCLDLVEEGARGPGGPGAERAWLERLEAEQDNLRAALEWVLRQGQDELALRLVKGQMALWQRRGRFAEARASLERVLAVTEEAPDHLRAAVLHDAGFAALMAGDVDAAEGHLRASVELSANGAEPRAVLRTRTLLAFVSTFGDDPANVERVEHAAAEVRATGDDALLAEALAACGQARMFRGEPGPARAHFEASLEASRRAGLDALVATSLVGLGSAELAQGDYSAVEHHLQRGSTLAAACSDTHTEVVARIELAELAHVRGFHDQARTGLEECLDRARAMGAPYPLARSLLGLARVRLKEGDAEGAQALFGEAASVGRSASLAHLTALALTGTAQADLALGDVALGRAHFDEALALARRRADEAAEAQALEGCAELASEAAIDYVDRQERRRGYRPSTGWEALTGAERRVAELAANGRTNAEIARELGVAYGTVKVHLNRVFAKLGVQTRASLAAGAYRERNDDDR